MMSQFTEAAAQEFGFLNQFGFALTMCSAEEVKWASVGGAVTVYWDARSGEIDVLFGPAADQSGPSYTLTEVMAMEGVQGRERPLQIANESHLGEAIRLLAQDTQTHGAAALRFDPDYLQRLDAFRRGQAAEDATRRELMRIRTEAELAWHRHDFDTVARLYVLLEGELSHSESLKLTYAKKHLNGRRGSR